MKKFEAHTFSDKEIILKSSDDIERIMDAINDNEDFIIRWVEGKDKKSQLMIATDLAGKIKTGDIKVSAKKENGGNK